MNPTNKAVFSLSDYKVKKFELSEPPAANNDISLNFDPSGKFYEKEKRFVLLFEFSAMYDENETSTEFLKIVIEANFIFDDQALNDGIPSYFYPNSIAIIFPYIRSFVSALSTLANMKPLILPLLNLNALQDVLLQNTEML